MVEPKYWVIIPAAGVGKRFGGTLPKQYQLLSGKPIIEQTLAKFLYLRGIEKIVVAVNAQDLYWKQLGLGAFSDKIITSIGGSYRCQSVFNALQAIAPFARPQDFVLVHDVVRPCIDHADITKLIATINNHPIGGILATRVRDTLKYTNQKNEIIDTICRENIWQALTPQMFRFQILFQALQQAIDQKNYINDEAAAIEALGFIPMVVEGRRDNIKITFPEDLMLAQRYLLSS